MIPIVISMKFQTLNESSTLKSGLSGICHCCTHFMIAAMQANQPSEKIAISESFERVLSCNFNINGIGSAANSTSVTILNTRLN